MIYTQDPGRALISGKCNDIGTIVMQQFRGLAARAPYFSNGSAAICASSSTSTIAASTFSTREREKQDLVNFLSTL